MSRPFVLELECGFLGTSASSWLRLEGFLTHGYATYPVTSHQVDSYGCWRYAGPSAWFTSCWTFVAILKFPKTPWRVLTILKDALVHLICTPVKEESIEGLVVFFHVAPYPYFKLNTYWDDAYLYRGERFKKTFDMYHDWWTAVRERVPGLWEGLETISGDMVSAMPSVMVMC